MRAAIRDRRMLTRANSAATKKALARTRMKTAASLKNTVNNGEPRIDRKILSRGYGDDYSRAVTGTLSFSSSKELILCNQTCRKQGTLSFITFEGLKVRISSLLCGRAHPIFCAINCVAPI